ncbi:MAG: alpha/beta hydrolase [Deltaproteobacteria bacterium]|nr:alpha/beta hydrolase [Deltaproteobacteria bacterium]
MESLAIAPAATGVRYRTRIARGIAPLADLYLPTDPNGASVVLVHGGGFVVGSRAMKPMRLLAARLSSARISVCAIDYRMIFRGGRLTEALDDVLAAHAFWGERVAGYGLDPARVSMIGLSAGGTLAILAAARAAAGTVHRLVSCFGLYELDQLQGPASMLPRLLFGTSDRYDWRMRSPHHAEPPRVPTLLLHGDDDRLVPVEQARRLAARREELGLPTKLVVYPGAPHGFFNVTAGAAASAATSELIAHVTG